MDRTTARKIKTKLLALLSAATLSMLATGTAMALTGEPIPFDNFAAGDQGLVPMASGNVDTTGAINGQITADCPTDLYGPGTVSCMDSVASDGMLQRQITVSGSGDATYDGTYVQFILIDNGASGNPSANYFSTDHGSLNFIGEDFVKMNNRGEGLASKQTIIESKFDTSTLVEDRFSVSTKYKYGWARGTSGLDDVWVNIDQNISALQYDGDITTGGAYGDATMATELFNETISVISDGPALTNTRVDIGQDMQLLGGGSGDAVQKFKHTRVTGAAYVNLSSDDFFGLLNGNPVLPGGTNGGNLTWAIGDELAATWVAYLSDGSFNADFGLTRYENLNNATETEKVSVNPGDLNNLEAGGGLYSYTSTGVPALDAILVGYDGQPLWNMIWRSLGASMYEPLYNPAQLVSYVNPVSMTDYSVQFASPVMGASNPDYIPNTSPTLPAASPGNFNPTDADYNNWIVTNGVFSGVACPLAADSCAPVPVVNEDGLFQREFIVNGVAYMQTIIVADGTVSGDPTITDHSAGYLAFRNETFVKVDNNVGGSTGIAARTQIDDYNPDVTYQAASPVTTDLPVDAGTFIQQTALNSGWANQGSVAGAVDPRIKVHQTYEVIDPTQIGAVSMYEEFNMETGTDQNNKKIEHYSKVGTREGAGGYAQPIEFKSVTVTGAYQNTESLVGDPFTMVADGTILAPTGDSLLWSKGDALQATWIGGEYATFSPTVSIVGTTSFANLTTAERIAYTSQVSPPDPDASWLTDPFGPVPSYIP